MRFAVITPTIGADTLAQCIESFRGQDCNHYLYIDGLEHVDRVEDILRKLNWAGLRVITNTLGQNVGKGWYGHRVYAAAAYLCNDDVICYMDEDNWAEPNYIESFKEVLNNYPWAYTLRRIAEPDGTYLCDDNCESLGQWPVVGDPSRYHIDTGCFAVRKQLALTVSPAWYGQWGADRQFLAALRKVAPNFIGTRRYTLNYRLGGPTSRATKEMFLQGNELARKQYKGDYPWNHEHADAKPISTTPQILTYNTTKSRL